jgi:hypothetical protein
MLLVLGVAMAGCRGNDSDQNQDKADPKLPRYTIKVPGMS